MASQEKHTPPIYKCSAISANFHLYSTGEIYCSMKNFNILLMRFVFLKPSSIKVTEQFLWLKLEINEKWLRLNIYHKQYFPISHQHFFKHNLPSKCFNLTLKCFKEELQANFCITIYNSFTCFKQLPAIPLHNRNNLCFALKTILILAVCSLILLKQIFKKWWVHGFLVKENLFLSKHL